MILKKLIELLNKTTSVIKRSRKMIRIITDSASDISQSEAKN